MPAPIFISHAHDDRKAAETICTALEQRGLNCWIATRDIGPGDNFQEAITRAIRSAQIMLLVFSGHANNSIEVKKEIALASRYNVIVVPVRVEDVVPNDALTYELAVRQWIDLFDDWEHAIERLVAHLSTMVHPEAPAAGPAPVSAARPTAPPVAAAPRPARRSRLLPVLAVLFAVLFLGAGGLAWHFWRELPHPGIAGGPPPPSTPPSTPPSAGQPPPVPSPAGQPPPVPSPAGQPSPRAGAPPRAPTPSTTATASVAAQAGGANPATFRDCPNCPEMVVIPAGRFEMGSTAAEQQRFEVPAETAAHELPRHDVVIGKPFALAKFDVTRAEFAAFISAGEFRPITGCQTVVGGRWMPAPRLGWDNPGFDQSPREPVVCINRNEIEAYLGWLRQVTGKPYRLASEAEWEYAARGGTTTAFYWGDDTNKVCEYENVADQTAQEVFADPNFFSVACRDGFAHTAPVGSFKPNPFGLHDMLGNIFVFTADCWNDNYAGAPADGSVWQSGNCGARAVRKAAFGVGRPFAFRAAHRMAEGVAAKRNRFGFRVALSLD